MEKVCAKSVLFRFDLGKKIALLQCTFAEVKTVAEYDVNGKILVLPVYGKGTSTIKMGIFNEFD